MPKSDKFFYRVASSDRLPVWLSWIVWAIAAILYLAGAAIGAIASDVWGYVRTGEAWRKRNERGNE